MTHTSTGALTSTTTLKIVRALQGGPLRFNALHRAAAAPNTLRLSHRLKLLARDGMVERHVIALGPPAVTEYTLTPLGADLANYAAPLLNWIEAHAGDVAAARDHHKQLVAARP